MWSGSVVSPHVSPLCLKHLSVYLYAERWLSFIRVSVHFPPVCVFKLYDSLVYRFEFPHFDFVFCFHDDLQTVDKRLIFRLSQFTSLRLHFGPILEWRWLTQMFDLQWVLSVFFMLVQIWTINFSSNNQISPDSLLFPCSTTASVDKDIMGRKCRGSES